MTFPRGVMKRIYKSFGFLFQHESIVFTDMEDIILLIIDTGSSSIQLIE